MIIGRKGRRLRRCRRNDPGRQRVLWRQTGSGCCGDGRGMRAGPLFSFQTALGWGVPARIFFAGASGIQGDGRGILSSRSGIALPSIAHSIFELRPYLAWLAVAIIRLIGHILLVGELTGRFRGTEAGLCARAREAITVGHAALR